MVGVGRRRFLAHQPFEQVGVGFLDKRLEAIEFCPVHAAEARVGIGAEQQVHFLGAAVPGAIAQATQSHRQFFTGVFLKGHDRGVSGNVEWLFTRLTRPCPRR